MTDSTSTEPREAGTETDAPAEASAELKAILADLAGLTAQAREAFAKAPDSNALNDERVRFLGKKGVLAELNRRFGSLSAEEKPIAGKLLNNHKAQIIHIEKDRREELDAAEIAARLRTESVDVTLPGIVPPRGHLHPVIQVQRQIEGIFRTM
ncbi:hypothetical protein HZA57_02525, partial [Candidatus Poribacteria bacterium]|nr:hypothetical protein [Candidatus Poribacteria bacterium]